MKLPLFSKKNKEENLEDATSPNHKVIIIGCQPLHDLLIGQLGKNLYRKRKGGLLFLKGAEANRSPVRSIFSFEYAVFNHGRREIEGIGIGCGEVRLFRGGGLDIGQFLQEGRAACVLLFKGRDQPLHRLGTAQFFHLAQVTTNFLVVPTV